MSRRRFLQGAAGALQAAGVVSLTGPFLSRTVRSQPDDVQITTTDIAGLILLQGAGCNVVAMPGNDGALMIDGGLKAYADRLVDAVLDATGNNRIGLLINTHWHPEVIGANETVGSAGGTIFAHENTRIYLSNLIYSSDFDERREPLPEPARPDETVRSDGSMEFSGTRIDYGYLPQAHTDGDLYLHFPEANVLVAGGVVSGERWPPIDWRNGAWYGGRVRALQWLAELVDPGTVVVPAHGRLIDGNEILRQRDIYDELFETMIGYMNMGFGPEDAVAHNPLEAWEAQYGDPSEFLDSAYRSMLIAYVPE